MTRKSELGEERRSVVVRVDRETAEAIATLKRCNPGGFSLSVWLRQTLPRLAEVSERQAYQRGGGGGKDDNVH